MKIFVAGATGVLGRRAVKLMVEAGHGVMGVARSDEKAALLRDLGATAAHVDIFDADALRDAVVGHDVVMNLATNIPKASKMAFRSAWKNNDKIRTVASRNLVDAALAAGAKRYIQESIAFVYEERGDGWIDEVVPLDLTSYTESVANAEGAAARFAASGRDAVVLRFGQFYGPDSEQSQLQVSMAKKGWSSFLGDPEAFMPPIHLDDTGTAVVAALTAPSGTYNVVDDVPMQKADADAAFAAAVGRKRLRRVPKGLVQLGGAPMRTLARSQRVSNRRFKDATGWTPSYPSVREGLPALVAQICDAVTVGR